MRLAMTAKRDDESASPMRPVSGDLATRAYLALVVSGVPRSGPNAKITAASAPSGSKPRGVSWWSSQAPRPTPPMKRRAIAGSIAIRIAAPEARSIRRYSPKNPPRISASGVGCQQNDGVAVAKRVLCVRRELDAVDRHHVARLQTLSVDHRRRQHRALASQRRQRIAQAACLDGYGVAPGAHPRHAVEFDGDHHGSVVSPSSRFNHVFSASPLPRQRRPSPAVAHLLRRLAAPGNAHGAVLELGN